MKNNNFVEKAVGKHNNIYDYSKINYVDSHTKVVIICSKHGEFEQSPTNHLQGQGCPKCGSEKSNKTRSNNVNNFIADANIKHNSVYDYSKVLYKNNYTKVIIICAKHGEFEQSPNLHLSGKGCSQCGRKSTTSKNTKNTLTFIRQAESIHNSKYDYSKVEYVNAYTKILIACKAHGDFTQLPIKHLCGQGCPRCVYTISKPEISWLDSIGVSEEYRHKTLKINGKNYMVDAYDPNTNIVYEFYGDYWHGNPNKYLPAAINVINKKSFGYLYAKTIERENKITEAGYKLVIIWESEYNK
jgi:ribosomal protein L37E